MLSTGLHFASESPPLERLGVNPLHHRFKKQ